MVRGKLPASARSTYKDPLQRRLRSRIRGRDLAPITYFLVSRGTTGTDATTLLSSFCPACLGLRLNYTQAGRSRGKGSPRGLNLIPRS
jgi:hypothetical protein